MPISLRDLETGAIAILLPSMAYATPDIDLFIVLFVLTPAAVCLFGSLIAGFVSGKTRWHRNKALFMTWGIVVLFLCLENLIEFAIHPSPLFMLVRSSGILAVFAFLPSAIAFRIGYWLGSLFQNRKAINDHDAQLCSSKR